jgi:hypothetical protein
MTKNQLRETLRNIIRQELAENNPAPSKPSTSPNPTIAPGKPGEKPGPRRPLGNPDAKPKPKATMKEADMLAQIIKRFKSKKDLNELGGAIYKDETGKWKIGINPNPAPSAQYLKGYSEGYEDGKNNKSSKY